MNDIKLLPEISHSQALVNAARRSRFRSNYIFFSFALSRIAQFKSLSGSSEGGFAGWNQHPESDQN